MDRTFYSGSKNLQFLSAIAATLGAFGLGTVLGWTSTSNLSLEEDPDFKGISKSTLSLLGSMVPVGALGACAVTGILIGKLGRKSTMLLTAPPFVIGWLIIVFAQNNAMLIIGRIVTGFCGGAFSLAAPVYIGEIAEPSLRGSLGSGFQLMVVLGILFVYCFGAIMNWMWLSVMCTAVPILFAAMMFFMPESPRYYLIKGNRAEAVKSLRRLRGAHSDGQVEPEIEAMERSVADAARNQASFKDLFTPSILKPTSISLGLMLFQQLGGVNAVIFYTGDIFKSAGTSMDANLSTIIVGIVQVAATVVSTVLADKAGRRILLLISDSMMGVSLAMLGAFFFIKEEQENTELADSLGWLPLVSMILFVTAFSLGFGPIPWMMVGEILPARVLGLASSIATVFNWFLAFLVTQFFADLKEAIHGAWCFWIFAIVCAIGTVYVFLIVPETKGKTTDEIQALFGPPSSSSPAPVRPHSDYPEKSHDNEGFEPEK